MGWKLQRDGLTRLCLSKDAGWEHSVHALWPVSLALWCCWRPSVYTVLAIAVVSSLRWIGQLTGTLLTEAHPTGLALGASHCFFRYPSGTPAWALGVVAVSGLVLQLGLFVAVWAASTLAEPTSTALESLHFAHTLSAYAGWSLLLSCVPLPDTEAGMFVKALRQGKPQQDPGADGAAKFARFTGPEDDASELLPLIEQWLQDARKKLPPKAP